MSVYSKVIQLQIYIYLFFRFFSHISYYRVLGRVPCSIQQVLVDQLLDAIFFWLRWVFIAARGLSLVAASRGYSLLQCTGFSLQWPLLLWSTGSRHAGFSSCGSCGTWAQQLRLVGSRAQAQQLWCTGLVALWHVGSSWTRARTRVPCIGRQILNHCATREAPRCYFKWNCFCNFFFFSDCSSLVLQHFES